MRIFISINLPKEVKEKIKKIQSQLPRFSGKKTEPENLHLTLKFLGEVSEEKLEKVKERLKKIKFGKFIVKLDSIGVFSEDFIRIVWLHLSNCDKLQKEIDEALEDLFKKEKRFMSHLTIARVKKLENKKVFLEKLKNIKIPEIKFEVDIFYLMKSELSSSGPKYSVLEKYDLKN